jgi:hypothetical protein
MSFITDYDSTGAALMICVGAADDAYEFCYSQQQHTC